MEKIGSKENLTRLINQYQNLIFSICLKLTGDYFVAEDLTQETFVSAFQHWNEFDGQFEKAWLCRIASNKCIDYNRAKARKIVLLEKDEIDIEVDTDEDPLKKVLNQEILEELKICCENLPLSYREVAKKHFLEGKTAKEIAEQSGFKLNTIQTKIYRARELLKKSFREEMLKE